MPRKKETYPEYEVAFGLEWPEECQTAVQAYEYLSDQFKRHSHGCFSVNGPTGNWSQYCTADMWEALTGDADGFRMYYEMVSDGAFTTN